MTVPTTPASRADAAALAFERWRRVPVAERAAMMAALADAIDERSGVLARLITSETPKTVRESMAELAKSAGYCRWLAEHAPRILAPLSPAEGASIIYAPMGVIAGILPWNFPLWQVFRCAAPALVAGNTVVIKHSPLVRQCAAAAEELFDAAGFDDGVFSCRAESADDAQRLIAHEAVRGVSFTGGTEAGRAVAATAGAHLKKCVLELGGSDAFIVMPSADLDAAVAAAVASRTRAGGQACTAAKRFLVSREIAAEFQQHFVAAMERLVVAAPLMSEEFADRLERQVNESVRAGAIILCGGVRLGPRVYAPTVVAVPHTDMPLMQEETFGPVAPLLAVDGIEEAIAAANRTPYGLSASLWTRDAREVAAFTDALDVGQLFVNNIASSSFDLPFGGTRASGYGRTLGEAGILEFVNIKSVRIRVAGSR